MTAISEDEIRERAYFKWLEEGCPEGRAEQHWLDAIAALSREPAATARKRKRPAAPSASRPARSASQARTRGRHPKASPA